jgi:hypothetical protein
MNHPQNDRHTEQSCRKGNRAGAFFPLGNPTGSCSRNSHPRRVYCGVLNNMIPAYAQTSRRPAGKVPHHCPVCDKPLESNAGVFLDTEGVRGSNPLSRTTLKPQQNATYSELQAVRDQIERMMCRPGFAQQDADSRKVNAFQCPESAPERNKAA